jgi:hypothetical protein
MQAQICIRWVCLIQEPLKPKEDVLLQNYCNNLYFIEKFHFVITSYKPHVTSTATSWRQDHRNIIVCTFRQVLSVKAT